MTVTVSVAELQQWGCALWTDTLSLVRGRSICQCQRSVVRIRSV